MIHYTSLTHPSPDGVQVLTDTSDVLVVVGDDWNSVRIRLTVVEAEKLSELLSAALAHHYNPAAHAEAVV